MSKINVKTIELTQGQHLYLFKILDGVDNDHISYEGVFIDYGKVYRNVQMFTYDGDGLWIVDSGRLPTEVVRELNKLSLTSKIKKNDKRRKNGTGWEVQKEHYQLYKLSYIDTVYIDGFVWHVFYDTESI